MPQTLPPPGLGLDDSSSLFVVEEDDDLPYPKNRNHTNHLSSNDDDDEKAALAMIPPALMDQIQLAAALSCCSPGSAAASRSASRAPSCVPPRSPAISLRARTTAPLAPSSPSSSPGGGSSLENGRCSGTVPITDEDGLSDPPTTAQVLRVAAATLATTTTLTLAAAAGPASAPGGPMPSTPRMLLNLIPQLVKTASQIGWQTSAALARHVLYGPPHTSWSWQATAVRAILRSAMIENPIALEGSTYLARRFTQFTYPTSPHKQAYVPTWLLFEGRTKETEMDKKWMESNVCTEAGQTAGYATSGEFVRSVGVTDAEIDQLVLYVHGGAFHFLSARTHRCITSKIVQYSPRTAVFATHQRLGPEHNHAAAVEDVILVYLALIGLRPAARHAYSEHPLANLNATALAPDLRTTVRCSEPPPLARRIWQPDQIVIAGDSSGGNTATSAVLVLKECGFPLPGSLALLSPWLDPPSTSASWVDNGPTCYLPADIPGLYEGVVEFCKPFACSHPFISPIYATSEMLRGLPPVLIQVGGGEVLRDEGIEWGKCIASVGGHVRVEVYAGVFHVFMAFEVLPKERHAAFTNLAHWLREKAPQLRSRARDVARAGDLLLRAASMSRAATPISPLLQSPPPSLGRTASSPSDEPTPTSPAAAAVIEETRDSERGVVTLDMAADDESDVLAAAATAAAEMEALSAKVMPLGSALSMASGHAIAASGAAAAEGAHWGTGSMGASASRERRPEDCDDVVLLFH